MSPRRFDSAAVSVRLQSQSGALASSGKLSAEETRRILEQRAARLATPLERPSAAERTDVLVFGRVGDLYGVEALHVKEVLPMTLPTPLPGHRAGLVGITNHRGRILAVVDPAGLRRRQRGSLDGQIVVVDVSGMTFALLADEIRGIAQIVSAELTATSPASEVWVRVTTGGLVSVLNLEALVGDPRVAVQE